MAQETSAVPSSHGEVREAAHRPLAGSIGGQTKIADSVVARIAGIAAREVSGVYDMAATGLSQHVGGLANRVTGADALDRGVQVQIGEIECVVDLNITGWPPKRSISTSSTCTFRRITRKAP
jgi:hypothetical protein